MIKKFLSILIFFCASVVSAQEQLSGEPEMADAFRDNGKIYVVIAVIAVVFVSIIAFLIYIERKLKKMEDQLKQTTDTSFVSEKELQSRH